jgi:hypothetical protein
MMSTERPLRGSRRGSIKNPRPTRKIPTSIPQRKDYKTNEMKRPRLEPPQVENDEDEQGYQEQEDCGLIVISFDFLPSTASLTMNVLILGYEEPGEASSTARKAGYRV